MKLTSTPAALRLICLMAFAAALLASPLSSIAAASKSKCFVNEGLKNRHIIRMTVAGSSLKGTYMIEDYDSNRTQQHRYTGHTRDGVHWKIKFQGGRAPYELPPGTKEIVWKWVKRGKNETLVVRMYGRNYETNRYSAYDATFEPCKASR
jgi:hypothetical protein